MRFVLQVCLIFPFKFINYSVNWKFNSNHCCFFYFHYCFTRNQCTYGEVELTGHWGYGHFPTCILSPGPWLLSPVASESSILLSCLMNTTILLQFGFPLCSCHSLVCLHTLPQQIHPSPELMSQQYQSHPSNIKQKFSIFLLQTHQNHH